VVAINRNRIKEKSLIMIEDNSSCYSTNEASFFQRKFHLCF
jgi:hypothetical protein